MQKKSTVNHLSAVVLDCPVFGHKKLKKVSLLYFMKVTLIQMTVAMIFSGVSIAFENHAQEILKRKISLELNDISLMQALSKIEKAAKVKFVYSPARINLDERISLDVTKQQLGTLLSELLTPRSIKFKVQDDDNYIILIENEKVNFSVFPIEDPVKVEIILATISGTVSDRAGEPMPGVNIMEKGTTNGTTTDVNGKYSFEVTQEDAVVVFSFIGYTTQEVVLSGRSMIDVVLIEDVQNLDEVVVVGYGTQKKISLTGSLSTVDASVLQKSATGNVSQALQGSIAGATITTANTPGSDAQIRIRGLSTINNNNPLWIVDGVPRTGGMNQLSPSEIESITVLKDASATAIYGARGANGVILVTTIMGRKSQPLEVTFNSRFGVLENLRQYDMLNVNELGEMLWLQFANSGIPPSHPIFGSGAEPRIPKYLLPAGADNVDLSLYNRVSYPITETNPAGTDWYGEIFNKGILVDNSLTVTGGSEHTTYAFSASALKEDGMVIKTGFERYTVRSNIAFEATKWLEIGENFGLSYTNDWGDQRKGGEGTVFGQLLDVSGIMPIYDVQGNWAPLTRLTGIQANLNHPLAELEYRKDFTNEDLVFNGNVYATASVLKNLSVKSQFGINYGNGQSKSPLEINPESYVARVYPELSEVYSVSRTWNWINTLDYKLLLNDMHNFNVLLGTEAISSLSKNIGASRNQFLLTNETYWVINAGEGNIQNSGSASDWSTFSIFGRLNYDFKNKYLASATIRRDGSSRFGANNRFGVFPAFSLGWIMTEEDFIKGATNWLDFMKVRFSWGKSGNDQIGNYNAFTTFSQTRDLSYYPIGGSNSGLSTGFQSAVFGNPNAKWESTVTTNIGIDATFFRKIDLTLDVWKRNTNDMLYRESMPMVVGQATVPFVNIGDMENKGFDLQIDYNGASGGDFKYQIGLVLSHYRNTVVKLSDNDSEAIIGPAIRDQRYTRAEIGTSFPEFFGYQVDGIFQTQEEADAHAPFGAYNKAGRFKFRDVNGDGIIDDQDRTYIGNPHPDFTTGLNSTFEYRNFDAAVSFYASVGNDILNMNRRSLDFNLFAKNRGKRRLYESWGSPHLKDNKDATMPMAEINDAVSQTPSSYFVDNGTFVRLQSIQLGYSIPTSIIERLSLKQFRLYAMVTNLFTITKYEGLDPQIQTDGTNFGIDLAEWPTPRRYVFGLNIKL